MRHQAWLAGALLPAAIALVAWSSGGELTTIICVSVVASVVTAVQFKRRGRGTAAQNLWQINLITFVVVAGGYLLILSAFRLMFAGYCDDGCEPARSPLPDLTTAAGASLLALALGAGGWLAWRRIERLRSPQQRQQWGLLVPVVLGWAAVGVASLPSDVLLHNPKPLGHNVTVAHEPCVTAPWSGGPCRSVSNLRAAADAGDLLLVWKNATGIAGVLSHDGRHGPRMDIAAVPHAQGQGDGGLAVAPARGGGFAVVWSVEQDPGLLQTAHVAADGTLTEPAGLGPGIAVTSYPVMSLVKMPAGYLLFVCDTPDPRHSGPTRLVVVPLDRKLRAQGGWRQILVGLRTDDWPLTAAALDVKTAAVTYQAAGGALSTLVVDAHGEIASTPTEDIVAVPAPDGGGSVMAVPAAPPNVRTGGKDSGRFPPPLGGMAGEGPGVRTLWSMEAKALRRDSGGERQHWVGGPTAGDPGWLAATDLREPQILVSSSGAWVLGYAFGEQGEGGGNAADVVLVRVPSS